MRKPDEREIIKIFQKRFGKKSKFYADDLEYIKIGNAKFMTKSDMLVQSTDVPPGMSFQEIARKSIVSCVSDFSCKGVRPRFATIALALPNNCNHKMIDEIAEGFLQASREFDLEIVGGDINEGMEIVIEVSMYGKLDKKIPTRRGSKIGDVIITTGPFGYCSAGLKIIFEHYKTSLKFKEVTRKKILNPCARFEFGIKAARYFSSSMDSSDGLSMTLNDMSEQSGKRFVITNLPTTQEVEEFAQQNKIDLEELVFCGGEEYEIVATISRKNLQRVRNIAYRAGTQLFEIGYVSRGENVIFIEGDRKIPVNRCGWTHLRS